MTEQAFAATALPTIDEIKDAQRLVYEIIPPTPQFVWPLLSERVGAKVWVKHENHTPTGAFKARTAVMYAAELFRTSPHISGLVTATRGNHGQAVALAASRFKVPAHVEFRDSLPYTQTGKVVKHLLESGEAGPTN